MHTPTRSTDFLPDGQSNLDDWRGLGDLITLATDRISAPVEGMHRAIAERWLGLAGPRAESVRRMYGGAARSIYKTIRKGGSAAGATVSIGAETVHRWRPLPPLWNTAKGSYVQSIFNAVWGDKFEDDQSTFRIALGLRDADGAPIALDPTTFERAFPRSTARLVVMLHGLGETERCWFQSDDQGLGELLEEDGFSVLLVRYNSGREISDNGFDLAELLDEIVQMWPVPVEDLALIGHSMGGLVARGAAASAQAAGHAWPRLTGHLVAIGAPHFGTPLEKAAHVVNKSLNLVEETRPLANFVGERSVGIKDLRTGPIIDDIQPEGIEQHFIAGSVTREPSHPVGALVGDLVVRVRSATGQGRQRRVEASDVMVVGGRHHSSLIHDADVHSSIRNWLTVRRFYAHR